MYILLIPRLTGNCRLKNMMQALFKDYLEIHRFYQGTLSLTDEVSLTVGARYTEEEKRAHAETQIVAEHSGLTTPNYDPLLAGLMGALFASYEHEFDEQRTTHQFLPAANLEWNRSEDSMFYISLYLFYNILSILSIKPIYLHVI